MTPVPPGTTAPTIVWEVENRFRLLKGQNEESRFYRDLSAYALEYDVWFQRETQRWRPLNYMGPDLIHPEDPKDKKARDAPKSKSPPRDYAVNYDVRTHSYRIAKGTEVDWISDNNRAVILRAANLGPGECVWTIDGEVRPPQSCAKAWEDGQPLLTKLKQDVKVSVRALGSGAQAEATVTVRDIKIVAFGDSFSAGEGNPHTQWRSWRVRARPATWLDPRCHRSLVSGPSLAAAYIARANSHLSVTLLHYGCSGASINDGLVTPWSLLETAQRANRRWVDRGYDLAEASPSQVAAGLGPYDIAPSQVDMALRDLTIGNEPTPPDVILLSVGGNDVGFAKIVTGLAWRWGSRVDGDLRAVPAPDTRPVITFDDEAWKRTNTVCRDEKTDILVQGVVCMGQRLKARVPYMLQDSKDRAKVTGFDVVDRELKRLGAPAKAVYVTEYPNFVMRRSEKGELVGCNDTPFDGRPALVPTVLALVPGLGMRRADAEKADAQLLQPLNRAVKEAGQENGWTVVDSHVTRDAGHGFCTFRRYFNTIADSHWNQGRTYEGSRPMGNFVNRSDPMLLPLKVGDRVVWDTAENCFRVSPTPSKTGKVAEGGCVRDTEMHDPVRYQLERKAHNFEHKLDQGGPADTSGSVHPNYFGHCSYAAAIVGSMAAGGLAQDFGKSLSPAFLTRVTAKDFDADDLCTPAAWGYEVLATPNATNPRHGG
jgi:hypothetical protein